MYYRGITEYKLEYFWGRFWSAESSTLSLSCLISLGFSWGLSLIETGDTIKLTKGGAATFPVLKILFQMWISNLGSSCTILYLPAVSFWCKCGFDSNEGSPSPVSDGAENREPRRDLVCYCYLFGIQMGWGV